MSQLIDILFPVTIEHYVTLGGILLAIAMCGLFINKRNVISILMAIELMLLSININFVAFSAHLQNIEGQIFAIFVLAIAAAESAIGLAITVIYYRNHNSIDVENANILRW